MGLKEQAREAGGCARGEIVDRGGETGEIGRQGDMGCKERRVDRGHWDDRLTRLTGPTYFTGPRCPWGLVYLFGPIWPMPNCRGSQCKRVFPDRVDMTDRAEK